MLLHRKPNSKSVIDIILCHVNKKVLLYKKDIITPDHICIKKKRAIIKPIQYNLFKSREVIRIKIFL